MYICVLSQHIDRVVAFLSLFLEVFLSALFFIYIVKVSSDDAKWVLAMLLGL